MAKTVRYYIDVDESGAIRGGKRVEDQFEDVDQASQKTGASAVALGNIMADAAMQMVGSLAQVVTQSQELFSVQEQAEQKVSAVIKATNGAAGFSVDELKTYAAELQQYTTTGDESFLESMSTMLTFRKVTGDTFKDAIELSADTAQIFGSLESATLQIGKALEDPVEGMTALRRVGVTFSEQQKEQVRNFLDQNNLAGAQGVILDNLRGQLGGVAREMAKTPTGKWEQFLNTVGDSQEDFGEIIMRLKVGMIPVFERLLSIGDDVVSTLSKLVGLDLASRLNDERMEMNALVFSITSLNEGNASRQELINELIQKYPEFIGKIDSEKTSNQELKSALEEVNKLYIDRAAVQIATSQQEEAISNAGEALLNQKKKESAAYTKLIGLNEEYGLGIDLSTGSIQENLESTRMALVERGKWTESASLGRIAVNDEARAASELIGIQNDLVVALNKVTDAQENVVEAAEFRKIVEDSLSSDLYPDVKSGSIAFERPELPLLENPEPVHVPIEIEMDAFEPIDLSAEILSDGSLETLNRQLNEIELLPERSINDLESKLGAVKNLHSAALTDQEREGLEIVQQGIEMQLEARRMGLDEEEFMHREANQQKLQMAAEYIQQLNAGYQLVTDFQSAMTDRRINSIQNEKDAALSAIDARLNNQSLSETQRTALLKQRERAEEQYQKKIDKLQRQQFNREKIANMAQVAANTAVAVSKVWGQTGIFGLAAQIPVLAMGAIQAATIAAQPNPYFEGGMILERLPEGMTTPGEKLISINETGAPEYVINAESAARFRQHLDLINYQPELADQFFSSPAFSQQFELGGSIDGGGSTTRLNSLTDQDLVFPNLEAFSTENISDAIEAGFEKLKANFKMVADGKQLKAVQDATDSYENSRVVKF